jgi:hypothetical protein
MTFKITIERAPIGVEFEVGSIAEAISILEQEDTNLRRVVSIGDSLSGNGGEVEQGTDAGGTITTEPTKGKPGRKAKSAAAPDPATAQAPPPMPIPGAAAPSLAPAPDGGIPPFLDRTASAAPPPPPRRPRHRLPRLHRPRRASWPARSLPIWTSARRPSRTKAKRWSNGWPLTGSSMPARPTTSRSRRFG